MSSADKIQRSILPIPDAQHVGLTTYDAKDPDTKFPPIEPLRPPKGAPNVLIVLLDDVGFGASSAFGGPIHTPTAERLAQERSQVQPLPHHRAVLADAPGAADRPQPPLGQHGRHLRDRDRRRPATARCCRRTRRRWPMTLKLNGYSTAQFGKCHEVPVWETSPMGPFDQWPTGGGGFEYFYGFIGGETNQWYPAIYEGTTPIEPREDARRGLPLHRGHDRQGDQVGAPAEGADARQAVLHVLRAGRHATRRITCRRSGSTSTRASSTRAGTSCARRPSRARSSSASSPRTRS